MASLLSIPLELLVAISGYLPTSDLASLRLTCKQVEKSLYEWFSQEFFTKKQFMLTHASLQALIDISKHESFSKKLTHLIIATNNYDDNPLRFRDSEAATRYIQGYEDQKALLNIGLDREMLTEAFQRLVNLHTIGIRDFNSNSRVRDGQDASWSSWGATTVYRETGIQLQFPNRGSYELGSRFTTHVFSSVLYALGKANRRPQEFEVLLRQHGLQDPAFIIPHFLQSVVTPTLQSLTTLLLHVDLGMRYLHTHDNGVQTDTHAGRLLRRFLNFTPNLTHLRLNFMKHQVTNNETFLEWLSYPAPSPTVPDPSYLEPKPVALPLLKNLEFGQLQVADDVLLSVIAKWASTLESLSLWRMNLHGQSAIPFGHKPNFWKDLFERLPKIPGLKLSHLKVGMLQQDQIFVNFKSSEDDSKPTKSKEYTGKKMDKFWGELQGEVFVEWPTSGLNDDSASDEDMADEDDDNDDDDDVSDEVEGSSEDDG